MQTKKYQIRQVVSLKNNAGSKANADCAEIARRLGYQYQDVVKCSEKEGILYRIARQIGFMKEWVCVFVKIPDKSMLLVQHPCHYMESGRKTVLKLLKKIKKVKFICVVHDVEELRKNLYNEMYRKEFENMLKIADVLIVHNEKMKNFFLQKGVHEDRIVILEIFDYLLEKENTVKHKFNRTLIIAGNLDERKSPYISCMGELKRVQIKLYGPNYTYSMKGSSNIEYCGSKSPNELPNYLKEGFGLVWDGDSIDTCSGGTGEYLRYNNPHKLSLYLASGLPVVIWREAAEAAFVQEHGVGICVSSLTEAEQKILEMGEAEYNTMLSNVGQVSDKLREGDFMKTAIERAESILNER